MRRGKILGIVIACMFFIGGASIACAIVLDYQSVNAAQLNSSSVDSSASLNVPTLSVPAPLSREDVQSIIKIKSAKVENINSAGGTDFSIEWINCSPKIIKYITFTVVPYNAVGDPVLDHYQYDATFRGQCTGPYNRMDGESPAYWRLAWYNNSIKTVKIVGIDIEYMDGDSVTLFGEESSLAFS